MRYFSYFCIFIGSVLAESSAGIQEAFSDPLTICTSWIEDAFDCGKPARKAGTYQFRVGKVIEVW